MRRGVQNERQQSQGQKCSSSRTFQGRSDEGFAPPETVQMSKMHFHRSRCIGFEPPFWFIASSYFQSDAERTGRGMGTGRE